MFKLCIAIKRKIKASLFFYKVKKSLKKLTLFVIIFLCLGIVLFALLPVKRVGLHSMYIKSFPLVVLSNLTNQQDWELYVKDNIWEKTGILNDTNTTILYKYKGNNVASRGSFAISIAVDGNSVLTIRDTAVFTGIMEKISYLANPSKYNGLIKGRFIELKDQLELAPKTSCNVKFSPESRAAQTIVTLSERKQLPVTSAYIQARYLKLNQQIKMMENGANRHLIYKNTLADSCLGYIDVGTSLPTNQFKFPGNLTTYSLPESKYIVAGFKGNYRDLPFKFEVVKDWLMKKHLYTSANWWVEQSVKFEGPEVVFGDSLYIVQPVYEFPAQF